MKGVVCVAGAGVQGTYLLRIAIKEPLHINLGRFRGGREIFLPAGAYLYVGSARGERGSATLPRRLLRHATRARGAPHPLRPALVDFFGGTPPRRKRLHWHVDYLLEDPAADLDAAYLICDPAPLESELARWLLADPCVDAPVKGVGAGDDPGGTHLLRVTAPPKWWAALPQRLRVYHRDLIPLRPHGYARPVRSA